MHFYLPTILFFNALGAAQHTYNITSAFQPGNFNKYHCANTAKVNTWLPECLRECHIKANLGDGCAYDDMACHCVNYHKYTSIIEPCAFPPTLHGNGTCTMPDLMSARPIISQMCNFFNATLYASYTGCPQELSKNKTLGLVAMGETVVSGVRMWNGTAGGEWSGSNVTVVNSTVDGGSGGNGTGNGTEGGSGDAGEGGSCPKPVVVTIVKELTHWNETKTGIWWKS